MSPITLFDNKTGLFAQLEKPLALGLHLISVVFVPTRIQNSPFIGTKYTFYIQYVCRGIGIGHIKLLPLDIFYTNPSRNPLESFA